MAGAATEGGASCGGDHWLDLIDELERQMEMDSDIKAIEDPKYLTALASIHGRNELEYNRIVTRLVDKWGKLGLKKRAIDNAIKSYLPDISDPDTSDQTEEDLSHWFHLEGTRDCVLITNGISTDKLYLWKIHIPKAANWLLKQYPIKTLVDSKNILYYYEGAYRPNGEQLIDMRLHEGFGHMVDKNRDILLTAEVQSAITRRAIAATYIEPTLFDKNLDIINLENGLYNWRTGDFTSHDPAYLSRIQIPVYYNPTAECPHIDELLKKKLNPRDVDKIYEFAGYCLYRKYDVIQKILLLVGPGNTYKSTVIDVLVNFCGVENTSSVSLEELGGKTFDKFSSSQLYNKLLNNAADLNGNPIYYTGLFKKLTSGKDLITAEFKSRQKFQFINTAKFVFSTNIVPPTADRTSGFYRRIEPILMNDTTQLDEELMRAITSPEELSGLFNRAVEVLPELLERKHFTNEYTVAEVTQIYQRMSDPVTSFANTCIEEVSGEYISRDNMYKTYVKFCKKCGVEPLDKGEFGKRLKEVMDWGKDRQKQRTFNGKPRVWCWEDVRVYDPDVKVSW